MRDSDNRPAPRPIPTGVVTVEYIGDGWYQVGIGRGRGSKVFNLSDAEARQLVGKLAARGITADESSSGQATAKTG